MGNKFAELAFTDTVKQLQQADGSRKSYARMETGADSNNVLTEREGAFIGVRDSFYMATVSETGWPYVQHRGGPAGFVRLIDEKTLGFPDFSGNRQFVSIGNLQADDRVSLFFMDYPNKARLKLLGRVRTTDDPDILQSLSLEGYSSKIERGFLIDVSAFDWNCPQHITPRFTVEDVESAVAPLQARIAELEAAQAG
ncbi:MAG: putative pyridoxine 5'-phosphate oxidase superfamily flavin-nucleotide-binding protein [Paracoccaceae bacterium]|jgi:predicted pyridoxine 5'-phosphate oxidase superfamily flavin-nucleotide-binding protein